MKIRTFVPILLMLGAFSSPVYSSEGSLSLAEFSASENDRLGWSVVNDGVMGGLSKGKVMFTEDGTLRFRGTLSLENNGGFSTVRTATSSYDLGGFEGVSLRVKGDGRTYQFRLGTDARYRFMEVSFMAEFKTREGKWTEVRIPFEDFVGTFRGQTLKSEVLDPSKTERFGLLLADKKSGTFDLEVDWIRAYGGDKETAENRPRQGDIVSLLSEDGRFQTLLTAASKAGLAEVLQSEGQLTLLAPTDDAFSSLPKEKIADLLKPENKETLRAILSYHVLPGGKKIADLLSSGTVETVQGNEASVAFQDGRIQINGAAVQDGDLSAANGIVHVIDKVLIPEFSKPEPRSKTILETAASAGNFTTLSKLVKLAELESALEGEGPFTVLAPTDDAFSNLPKATVNSLTQKENRSKLQSVLKYHVLAGRLSVGDLLNGATVKTLQGQELKVQFKDGNIVAQKAKILAAEIACENGVIHVIDAVLVPDETGESNTAQVDSERVPSEKIISAIEKGVPIFNSGDHGECAEIYKRCLTDLKQDERVSEHTRRVIGKTLDAAAFIDSKTARAWVYRRLMDHILESMEHSDRRS